MGQSNAPRGDDFVGCLAGNLRAATRAVTRIYDNALRPHGLRITQVTTLVQIRHLQNASVTQLAAALGSERSGVARDIAVLETAGLVASRISDDDRRVRQVSLTAAGRIKLRDGAPAWRAAQEHMRQAFGDDAMSELVSATIAVTDRLADR